MKSEIVRLPRTRRVKGYLWLASALIVCPCHLPLLMALAGGTAFAALLRANWNLAVALSMGYAVVALLFAFRPLGRDEACAVPGIGRSPVLALVLSAFLPGLGQAYNRQRLKAGGFFAAGVIVAWPLLSPVSDSLSSLTLWLVLPTALLAAVEIGSMVDGYRAARTNLTRPIR